MRRPIIDEFSDLPVSRQRKYQLRKKRDRRCTECGAPAPKGSRCLKHLILARERQRERLGLRNRYQTTLSYRLEALEKNVGKAGKRKKSTTAAMKKRPATVVPATPQSVGVQAAP